MTKADRIPLAREALAKRYAEDPERVRRGMRSVGVDRDSGWCIVRTNGRRTLRLAQSLNDVGIEAWTPRTVHRRRLSRIHMGYRDVDAPIIPSFVFVRGRHLSDLLGILAAPNHSHPPFSIFQHAGRAPVIADRDIAHLQAAEEKGRRARRKAQRRAVSIGEQVKPVTGAFAGLIGIAEKVGGNQAVVCFNEHFRVKVSTWLLIEDDVEAA